MVYAIKFDQVLNSIMMRYFLDGKDVVSEYNVSEFNIVTKICSESKQIKINNCIIITDDNY